MKIISVQNRQMELTPCCFGFQSMIELSRTQDEEVGDGTTSVIILGKLPIEAFELEVTCN
jgi:chaperonin GroEL (HSP60 family)